MPGRSLLYPSVVIVSHTSSKALDRLPLLNLSPVFSSIISSRFNIPLPLKLPSSSKPPTLFTQAFFVNLVIKIESCICGIPNFFNFCILPPAALNFNLANSIVSLAASAKSLAIGFPVLPGSNISLTTSSIMYSFFAFTPPVIFLLNFKI